MKAKIGSFFEFSIYQKLKACDKVLIVSLFYLFIYLFIDIMPALKSSSKFKSFVLSRWMCYVVLIWALSSSIAIMMVLGELE